MAQQSLQLAGGALTDATLTAIASNFGEVYGRIMGVGKVLYCDYANGSDSTGDGSAAKPYQTLATAYAATTTGKNDIVVIVGDGGTAATQRQTAAFTWSNSATHCIGVSSPSLYSQRARIAPTTTATAYTPLMTISGNGCLFANIQFWHGFTTGTATEIDLSITGSRNVFKNCHIAGIGDTTAGNGAGSRCVKLATGGENLFEDCVIGVDTVLRSAANASVEFASGTTRNVFRRCHFPFQTDDATVLGFIGSAAACMDRHQIFDNCLFVNAIKSTSTTMTALGTLAASAGGLLLFKDCALVGIGEFGSDATTLALCYVAGGDVTAASAQIAVNPS